MGVAQGHIEGVETRLCRVSFTGQLGYELNIRADYAAAVWQRVWDAGRPLGMIPYGTESMHVLRAEKGYIIVGQETDGTVTPDDVGLGWAINRAKSDFVGKRSLTRPAMAASGRKQLVGILTEDATTLLEEGAQITEHAEGVIPRAMLGHITSSYFSPALRRPIALALVSGGRSRIGQSLFVPIAQAAIRVQVVSPVFYDADGARLHG
jgi:sarcosine oxidase subunit alpha